MALQSASGAQNMGPSSSIGLCPGGGGGLELNQVDQGEQGPLHDRINRVHKHEQSTLLGTYEH